MDLVIGIILIVAALFLIIAVLLQHGKDHNLSGTIAGAGESFFGKSKSTTIDKKLSVITSVVAVIFAVLVLVLYLTQRIGKNQPETTVDSGNGEVVVDESGTESDTAEAVESESESAEESGTDTESESAEESESDTESAGETEGSGD